MNLTQEKQEQQEKKEKQKVSFWWIIMIAILLNAVTWYFVSKFFDSESGYLNGVMLLMIPMEIAFITALRMGGIKKSVFFAIIVSILSIILIRLLSFFYLIDVDTDVALSLLLLLGISSMLLIFGAFIGKLIYDKKSAIGYNKFSKILVGIILVILHLSLVGLVSYKLQNCQTSDCYMNKARIRHDPNICAKINRQDANIADIKQECRLGYNIPQQNCENERISFQKKLCYDTAFENNSKIQQCEIITNLSYKEECYIWFATKNLDKNICHRFIDTKEKQDECIMRVRRAGEPRRFRTTEFDFYYETLSPPPTFYQSILKSILNFFQRKIK